MKSKFYLKSRKFLDTTRGIARGILLCSILGLCTQSLSAQNDLCGDAIDIFCGQTISGSTVGSSTTGSPAFCTTTLSTVGGVWYHFAGTGDVVTVSTCSPGTSYDTKIGVFSGSCDALVCVNGDDDDFTCPFSGLQSTVFFASVGVDYYILVTGFGTSTGVFDLSLTCMPRPSNDDMCDWQPLSFGAPTPFNNIGATVEPGEPSPGPGTVGPAPTCDATDGWCSFETGVQNSVWFSFISPVECVSIAVSGGDFQLAVWQGGCDVMYALIEAGANDDGGPGLEPLLNLEVNPGWLYFVQVDGFAGFQAPGTITVGPGNCPPPPIVCQDEDLTLTINLDNFPGETTWELLTDQGEFVAAGGPYATPGGTVVEQLCSDPDCYEFTIFDSFGDGICCGFGLGSYTLEDAEGTIIASGGAFGASETTSFCTTCPSPWDNTDIGPANGGADINPCDEIYEVEANGFNNSPFSDVQHTGYQNICGDVEIIVKVEDIVNAGWAGIQIRESLAPGAKKVALKTQLHNFIRRDIRMSTNGFVQSQQYPRYGHTWLRLIRSGNLFFGFTSLNGVNWQPILTTQVPMTSCTYVGFYTEGVNVNLTTTSNFSNVSLTGMVAPFQAEEGQDLALEEYQVLPGNSFDGGIDLYPNPASTEVSVKLGSLSGKAVTIQAFNELGQEVLRRKYESANSVEQIPINDLIGGMYFMKISSDENEAPVTLKLRVLNRP